MCLIIDANYLSLTFAANPIPEVGPLLKALLAKRATAVYGGQLAREYARVSKFRKLLAELDRQGIMRQVSTVEVDRETEGVRDEGTCVSDDPHIIALARVASVRLLCSHDQALHQDYTNPVILKPPGSVYQTRKHAHLIRRHCTKSTRRPQHAAGKP